MSTNRRLCEFILKEKKRRAQRAVKLRISQIGNFEDHVEGNLSEMVLKKIQSFGVPRKCTRSEQGEEESKGQMTR